MTGKQNYTHMSLSKMMKLILFSTKTNLNIDQRGSVLIMIISTIVVLSALTAGVVNLKTTSTYSQLYTNQQKLAYYLAESGGRYIIPEVTAGLTQAITNFHGKEFQLASSNDKFTISIDTATEAPNVLVVSTGIVNAGTSAEVRQTITYELESQSVFDYGAFATSSNDKAIEIKDDGYVDYFNSNDGPYSGLPGTYSGNPLLAVNRTGSSSIKLKDDAIIYGDVYVGPGGSASNIKVEDDAEVKGSKLTLSDTRTMSAGTYDWTQAGATNLGDEDLDGNDNLTLTAGTYRIDDLTMDDNATLTISGDVILYLTDDLEMKDDDNRIYINNGASLTIYATGHDDEIKLRGNVDNQNTVPKAEQFQIYADNDFDKIEVKLKTSEGDAKLYAAIYAPNSEVKFKEDTQLFGAAVGQKVKVEDDAAIHYDKALTGLAGGVTIAGTYIQY